jgi:hypothetical protein
VIVAGLDKGNLSFYLAKKPQINLFSAKKEVMLIKKLLMALESLFSFLPLRPKEKSLYNLALTRLIKRGRG